MGLFTITTNERTNLPPSQVGDGSAQTNYGENYIFTIADFTTLTVPPYQDPEGDAALNLRVTSLPSIGTLEYNSVAITVNQVIPFSGIGSGQFAYIPDPSQTNTYDIDFNFEIADSGSGQFVG